MKYIIVEVGERNFMLASLQIGTKDKYTFVATCRNRGQAERLLAALNGSKA